MVFNHQARARAASAEEATSCRDQEDAGSQESGDCKTKVIAFVPPGHCLGALHRKLQFPHRCPLLRRKCLCALAPFKNEAYMPWLDFTKK